MRKNGYFLRTVNIIERPNKGFTGRTASMTITFSIAPGKILCHGRARIIHDLSCIFNTFAGYWDDFNLDVMSLKDGSSRP
jgi:hypothetical protein